MMNSIFNVLKATILTCCLFFTSTAALASPFGSDWYEFRVNESHSLFDKTTPFAARISFTNDRLVPTIGREQGGRYAENLYIELYTFDRAGACPTVGLTSRLSADSSELVYEVALKYEASANKCYAEISASENLGRFVPGGNTTVYRQHPITLLDGSKNVQHRLYVKDAFSYRDFSFALGDSL